MKLLTITAAISLLATAAFAYDCKPREKPEPQPQPPASTPAPNADDNNEEPIYLENCKVRGDLKLFEFILNGDTRHCPQRRIHKDEYTGPVKGG